MNRLQPLRNVTIALHGAIPESLPQPPPNAFTELLANLGPSNQDRELLRDALEHLRTLHNTKVDELIVKIETALYGPARRPLTVEELTKGIV